MVNFKIAYINIGMLAYFAFPFLLSPYVLVVLFASPFPPPPLACLSLP